MSFFQESPRLGNQYDEDVLLREYVERVLPPEVKRNIEPELRTMGALAGGPLFELSLRSRKDEPQLIHFDPWGRRIDEIRVPEAWMKFARISSEHGLVAIPYERRHGAFSRIHQFAMVYLFGPSSSIYTCPLAMSDGAARTLQVHQHRALLDHAFPRLISLDPKL